MFTVEYEDTHTKAVILDEQGLNDDVELYLADDGQVYIRQYCEELDEQQLIILSYHQFIDIMVAADSDEGVYKTKVKDWFL